MPIKLNEAMVQVAFTSGTGTYQIIKQGVNSFLVNVQAYSSREDAATYQFQPMPTETAVTMLDSLTFTQ